MFISARLRPSGDTLKSPIGSRGGRNYFDPVADTKITVGLRPLGLLK
jgi:hypothetical protein